MTVYFISGLAADRSIFKHLQLPTFCSPVYLDWIEPSKNETLQQYALRLAKAIDTTAPFALVGLSFGGMLAAEIATQTNPVCTILISSISNIHQLPAYFKIAARMRLHKVIPIGFLQKASLLKRLFSTETTEDKRVLKAMIRKSDPRFIRWALHAILTWQNTTAPNDLIHIHSTTDLILPLRFVKPTHVIPGGGHLLVLNRVKEVNQVLAELFHNLFEKEKAVLD